MDYIVNTPCGPVQGAAGPVPGTAAFKGIRYARAGRWEYPRIVESWEGTYDATKYGNCSYQPRSFYNEEENLKKIFYYHEFRKGETYTYSEDCLFLNIFTPEELPQGKKLPVLVYIHGGGFTGGCGHEKHFDGPQWPLHGCIAVTLNYRLGPMGFLTLPQLKEEAGKTGNYGLYDQLAAVTWVSRNIAAFGGDPGNITLMGQSAGAMSVQQHCLSPLSDGLFHKAVMSSGCGVSKMLSAQDPGKYYEFWQKVMELAGCATLEQFRSVAPEKLFAAWQSAKKEVKGGGQACSPVLDGELVVGTGVELLASGAYKKIPCMAGVTSQDMMPPILYSMAKNWIGHQEKSYLWYFRRQLPGDKNGAWHSSDLWYWFGTLGNCWRPLEDCDREISGQMVRYLCNFAATGDPNGKELPTWTPGTEKAMTFGEGPTQMMKPSMLKMVYTMLTSKAVGE